MAIIPLLPYFILYLIFAYGYYREVRKNAELALLNLELIVKNEGYQAEIVSQYRIILEREL